VLCSSQKPVIRFQEFQLANYRNGRMCQQVFLPLQVDDGLFVVLRDHENIVGYSVVRSPSMRRFTQEEETFLKLAEPHIACGVKDRFIGTNYC
jgi:hypothetical protein